MGDSRAQVDGDIEDRAAHAAHQLRLAVRLGLVVHSAQRSGARVERGVALHDRRIQPARAELLGIERACEPAALVAEQVELDDPRPRQRRLAKLHQRRPRVRATTEVG